MAEKKLPKLAIVAAAVAFLIGGAVLLAAVTAPVLIFTAAIPAWAGISILRRRAWGAYGFALYELLQAAAIPLLGRLPPAQSIGAAAVSLAIAVLFFFAGRALAASGAERGMAWPWIAASCLFTFPFFFLRAFVIPSGAMEDTLLIGDKVLSTTFPKPVLARGDLVVFRYPVDPRQIFVKRVVGIGGDRVRITARVLYRNGQALREPYVVHKFPMMHARIRRQLSRRYKGSSGQPGPGP